MVYQVRSVTTSCPFSTPLDQMRVMRENSLCIVTKLLAKCVSVVFSKMNYNGHYLETLEQIQGASQKQNI